MEKPRVSQVPESMLFDNTDDCFKAVPEDPAVPMVGVYDYDLLRQHAEKLAVLLGVTYTLAQDGIMLNIESQHGKICKETLASYTKAFPKGISDE